MIETKQSMYIPLGPKKQSGVYKLRENLSSWVEKIHILKNVFRNEIIKNRLANLLPVKER